MLYIYLKKSCHLEPESQILLKDIAEIYESTGANIDAVSNISFGVLHQSIVLITAVDAARAINDEDAQLLGEPACSVRPKTVYASGLALVGKTLLVGLTLFFGAGMTIMNFHSDVGMVDVHSALALMLTGSSEITPWVSVVYCIGVGFGVLFFANMLPGKKRAPSIFEVEQFELDKQIEEYERAKAEEDK